MNTFVWILKVLLRLAGIASSDGNEDHRLLGTLRRQIQHLENAGHAPITPDLVKRIKGGWEFRATMRIEIKNLMGIASAAVEFAAGKVVEIVGPNASGKTSFATALQAVLARDANPAGLPAPQARRAYLRDGCEEGSATLDNRW